MINQFKSGKSEIFDHIHLLYHFIRPLKVFKKTDFKNLKQETARERIFSSILNCSWANQKNSIMSGSKGLFKAIFLSPRKS